MQILRKLYKFNIPIKDLIIIYIIYLRCYLEESCVLWHSSLTVQQSTDLERVQRIALRIILKDQYLDYEHALDLVELETLEERREKILSCLKHDQHRQMFPQNPNYNYIDGDTRFKEKFVVQTAKTSRLQNSAIPYMQNLLNKYFYSKK